MKTTETTNQHFIKIGQKVEYKWDKPYDGITPGKVVGIKRNNVIVSWKDGTETTSSKQWYYKYVREVND